MQPPPLHEEEWEYVRTLLPPDLEESARHTKALSRRRNVADAAALMRMALAYAISDLSLKDVAAWASTLQVAQITGPGLFYRLREAEVWLERVLAQILAEQVPQAIGGWPIRVVDATVLNGPGPTPVQWRAHVLVNAATGGFRAVELTDDSGGEKLGIYLEEKEAQVPATGAIEFKILIPVPPKPTKSHKTWDSAKAVAWISARAIAARTRTGEVIWILTTLDATVLPAVAAMALYRLRWQIELLFKRLKSLLHLDTLPSRQGPTAKSWMLARLIAAALAQRLVQPSGPLSPWGYQLRTEPLHA